MDVWELFFVFLHENLEHDEVLRTLSKDAETSNDAFETLLRTVSVQLQEWWRAQGNPETVGRYYEDLELMQSYEARQVASVPGRESLFSMAIDSLGLITDKPVLEVCAGSGAGSRRLQKRGAIVVASDAFPILTVHADELQRNKVNVVKSLADGDLRGTRWCAAETYQDLLGPEFVGFAGILGFMGLPLIADRAHAYQGMQALLKYGGKIAIVHDPEIQGRPLPTSAQTIRDIIRYQKKCGITKTMLEVTAKLLMRRGILHDEHRRTLGEEVTLIEQAFGNCTVERHPFYHEWVLLSACKNR